MYVQQADLTRGVGRDFVDALTAMSVKESHEKGKILFKKGEPAKHAYLLLKGRVYLKMGETGQVVHIVSRPGETFGWSSFVGRALYSTTAECVTATLTRKLDMADFKKLVEKDPANGLIFFQRLAAMLGDRLMESYAAYEKRFQGDTFV